MVTSVMPISVMTRFITSTGHGEPAMTPVRRLDRSKLGEARVGQLGDEHGRHSIQDGAALLLDGGQGGRRLEGRAPG